MSKQLVLEFVKAINAHDVDRICGLMADEHKFIDAHGNEVISKEKMKPVWEGYFEMFPDYKIEITDIFEKQDPVIPTAKVVRKEDNISENAFLAIFGFASGTYKGVIRDDNKNHFRLPASWTAIVENDKIKLWQVYCDTKVVFDTMDE